MRYQLSDGVRVVEEQGTFYLIPLDGRAVRLNRSASLLWPHLESCTDTELAVAAVREKHEIPMATCEALLHSLLASLEQAGLATTARN